MSEEDKEAEMAQLQYRYAKERGKIEQAIARTKKAKAPNMQTEQYRTAADVRGKKKNKKKR